MSVRVSAATRLPAIDLARGLAVAMMFVYHFCFDLANLGFIRQNLYDDARWIAWRSLILASFLLLVGVAMSLAWCADWSWPAFRRRLALIGGCAALVSAGSYLMFPASWIYFGVLHHIVLASLLLLPVLGRPQLALLFGVLCLVLGTVISARFFDTWPWQIFGLMTHRPRTEDYVPLLPWLGMVYLGAWVGSWLATRPPQSVWRRWRPNSMVGRTLALAGRHSLLLYMLHQPLFIALLQAVAARH